MDVIKKIYTSKIQLIWNILSWLDYFKGKIKLVPVLCHEKEHMVLLENGDISIGFNLNNKQELLATDCALTWWANMGHENHVNSNGENICDFDLTKKKNRDKFTA